MSTVSEQTPFAANIVTSTGEPLAPENDTLYLNRVFAALAGRMGDAFTKFTFVVHRRVFGEFAGKPIRLDPGGADRILIVISDEAEVFPCEEFSSYRLVFRAYGNPAGGRSGVYPFPVGYMNAAGMAGKVPFAERTAPVFFSGYLNGNRVDLFKQLRPIPWLPKRNLPRSRYVREIARRAIAKLIPERSFPDVIPGSTLAFTEWFAKGLPPAEYADMLANARIALCPPGFVSNETIRHWEAMRLGCAVISSPLPPSRFYKDSPIIQLADWSELMPTIQALLADPSKLSQIHEATVEWWDRRCSPAAVAEYMAGVIESSH